MKIITINNILICISFILLIYTLCFIFHENNNMIVEITNLIENYNDKELIQLYDDILKRYNYKEI